MQSVAAVHVSFCVSQVCETLALMDWPHIGLRDQCVIFVRSTLKSTINHILVSLLHAWFSCVFQQQQCKIKTISPLLLKSCDLFIDRSSVFPELINHKSQITQLSRFPRSSELSCNMITRETKERRVVGKGNTGCARTEDGRLEDSFSIRKFYSR